MVGRLEIPTRLAKIRETRADVFIHTCEVCGEWGCFGFGVSYKAALNAVDKGDIAGGKELLGRWYCLEHLEG